MTYMLKLICFVCHLEIICITLFILLCCVAANENVYQRTTDTLLQNTFKTISSPSRVVCCAYCDQTVDCMSVSYQNSSKTCKISTDPLVAVSVNGHSDTSWDTYSKNDWMLVFRATPGIGGDIYTAWINGNDVALGTNYRNAIVDSWTSIGMTKAKFAFYKNDVEGAFVVFDATGSNVTSWFSNTAIIESSWTALASDNFNYFSIYGHDPGRRFYIYRNYGGCPADTGYSIVIVKKEFPCSFDNQLVYPQFVYSNSASYGSPNSMTGMDKADVMAIFIKK